MLQMNVLSAWKLDKNTQIMSAHMFRGHILELRTLYHEWKQFRLLFLLNTVGCLLNKSWYVLIRVTHN
jgi:hypothetical protein